jgi:hypothetical protein
LSTDIVEAIEATTGCGNDVLAVLIRDSGVEADATDVGKGCTELLPEVSKEDIILCDGRQYSVDRELERYAERLAESFVIAPVQKLQDRTDE